jgi:hypothetical protein
MENPVVGALQVTILLLLTITLAGMLGVSGELGGVIDVLPELFLIGTVVTALLLFGKLQE